MNNRKKIVDIYDYWNQEKKVSHFNSLDLELTWFEKYLLNKVIEYSELHNLSIDTVHIAGCGAGREISEIEKKVQCNIICSDFSPRMISSCQANIEKWGLDEKVSTMTTNLKFLHKTDRKYQIIFAFNNTLNYIRPLANRESALKSIYYSLDKGGYFIGVVHSRYGSLTPTIKGYMKAIYFYLQPLFDFKNERGDRAGGHGLLKSYFHYYTRRELKELLHNCSFEIIELMTIGTLSKLSGRGRYISSYNNLIFIARKV